MNHYDSDQIAAVLKPLEYKVTPLMEMADLVIVNTCAIREKAEQKVFSFLGRLADMKRLKPDLLIGVGGCVAQQEGAKIMERMGHVDLVFGTSAISRLPRLIEQIESERCRVIDVDMSEGIDEFDFAGSSRKSEEEGVAVLSDSAVPSRFREGTFTSLPGKCTIAATANKTSTANNRVIHQELSFLHISNHWCGQPRY